MPPFIQFFYTFFVSTALAANTPSTSPSAPLIGPGATTTTGITSDIPRTFSSFASETLQIVTLLAGILAVFYLIYAGMQYVASSGNTDRVKTARAGIVNAVIGIVVIVASYFIIRIAVNIGSEANNSVTNSSAKTINTPSKSGSSNEPLVTDAPNTTGQATSNPTATPSYDPLGLNPTPSPDSVPTPTPTPNDGLYHPF